MLVQCQPIEVLKSALVFSHTRPQEGHSNWTFSFTWRCDSDSNAKQQCKAEPLSSCICCWVDSKCQKQLSGSVTCGDCSTPSEMLHLLNSFTYLDHQPTMQSHWFIAEGWREQRKDLFSLFLCHYQCNWRTILFLNF